MFSPLVNIFRKLDEPDMRDTAGEVETRSEVKYSSEALYMGEQRQDDQLEPTYSSSVPILDVAVRTCQKQWTIGRGGERGSGISVLMVRHDDDDDDENISHKPISNHTGLYLWKKTFFLNHFASFFFPKKFPLFIE